MGGARKIALHGTPLRILCGGHDALISTCGDVERIISRSADNQEQNALGIKDMKVPAPLEMSCADGESADRRENDVVAWAKTAAGFLAEVVANALLAAIVLNNGAMSTYENRRDTPITHAWET